MTTKPVAGGPSVAPMDPDDLAVIVLVHAVQNARANKIRPEHIEAVVRSVLYPQGGTR